MKETITHNWGRSHIYPRMTRSEVDWFMGKRFFWGVEVMKVVGREQVGWSPLIQDDMYVAVVEYQVREHNAHRAEQPGQKCMWEPCTFILFGQQGETHDAYHKRKGRC